MMLSRRLLTYLLLLAAASAASSREPDAAADEFFEKKIRPLLVDNCHKCHTGPKKKADLALDSREGLLKGGDSGPAIVPGEPGKSLLIKAIGYTDPDLRMPPRGKLSEQQIGDLTAWVKMGAPWPQIKGTAAKVAVKPFNLEERRRHWSLQPVQRPAVPAVQQKDWPLNPIDHFILARLESAGLKPNPPADPVTILRRLYFDLIGLPPTADEVRAFQESASRNPQTAIEEVVARLLASPHYGERWARHWLDLVRFAETYGHEFDFEIPEAWRYRDYVIRALNADVPYDQFVLEHIAGDLLLKPRRHPSEKFNESIIGTGFWWLGEAKHSPVDVRGDQADRIDNQIDVFGKTFLGTTLACARCHDHKFDAVSQRDYYALVGFLQSTRQDLAFIDDPAALEAMTGKLTPLRVEIDGLFRRGLRESWQRQKQGLPSDGPETRQRWQMLSQQASNVQARNLAPFLNLLAQDEKRYPAARKILLESWQKGPGPASTIFADFKSGNYRPWFVTGQAFGAAPLRPADLVMQSGSLPALAGGHLAHSGALSPRLQGTLRSPTFTITKNKIHYLAGGQGATINLILDGLQLIRNPIYGGLTISLRTGSERRWLTQDVSMWLGHRAYIEVLDDGNGFAALEQVVFANEGPPPTPANPILLKLLAHPQADRAPELAVLFLQEASELLDSWSERKKNGVLDQAGAPELLAELVRLLSALAGPPSAEMDRLLQEYRTLEADLPVPRRALACAEGTAINERLHIRGNHKNLGEEVPRRFLEVLVGKGGPQTRLELAQHIASPNNPLTARVMVNRLWQHHFGAGIVRSVDDFGTLGQPPSHPELLDWLASEFVRQGWSLKKMHRLMVLSQTYRMSSRVQPDAAKVDGDNKLLHRFPVRRLEAECIRDSLLAVSGRLDRTMFGPGVMPHLTPHMAGRGRPGMSGPLDGNGRRSIYLNVRRNFLTPMFLVFDYPVPFSTIGRRSVSNVPAQALTLLNNPLVIQQTELWAKRVLAEPARNAEERLQRMFLTALGRPPTPEEVGELLAFVQQTPANRRAEEERLWADVAHVLVNLKEFVYLN